LSSRVLYKGNSIRINSLSMARICNQVEDSQSGRGSTEEEGSEHKTDRFLGWQNANPLDQLIPPRLTFLEVGNNYAMLRPSFDSQKFETGIADDDLLEAVVLVLQHKSEVAAVDLLVPFRVTQDASTVSDIGYSDLLEEGVVAQKPLISQPKPSIH
jgi:hypothetical protein